ncbi:MAG: tryptophan--tRNA ligase [Bacteroidales bacterium]|nr:tryptophan--tRNA ligase [Bacteroidales bacterium]
MEEKKQKIILTGDRPTGRLHIGHYVGSLRRRVELQNSGAFDKIYIMIADAQALTDNADNPEKVRQNIIEVALDYMSAGLDPAKSHLFIQSQVPELTELTFYYMNLVTVQRLQRNPTVKQEMQLRGFSETGDGSDNKAGTPVGFFCYPISQASDITAFKATTVPVGEDQEPMIEQTREIVRKFNAVYGPALVEPEILLPDNAACLRLPGTDGKAKMSKSLGNCIYLSDSAEEVKTKVRGMFTDPGHLQVSDPGKVEGNTVFTYLDAFCLPEHFERFGDCFHGRKVSFDFHSLDEVKVQYRAGGLGDVMIKNFLTEVLNDTLEPIRVRRKALEQDLPYVYDVLRKGTEAAREAAAETLADVKRAMRINYFDPGVLDELIEEQKKKFAGHAGE